MSEGANEYTDIFSWTCPKAGVYAVFVQSLYAAGRPTGIKMIRNNATMSVAENTDYLQVKTWAIQRMEANDILTVQEKLAPTEGRFSGYGVVLKL